jgi:hypothetical protein
MKWAGAVAFLIALGVVGAALWRGAVDDQLARTPFDADACLQRSLVAAEKAAGDAELSSLRAGVVDPDGKIHPELRGLLALHLRSPSHGGAPAPIPGAPRRGAKCPQLRVSTHIRSGARASRLVDAETSWGDDESCAPSSPAPLKCTIAAIWKRALADGAPKPAYADVRLDTADGGKRVWTLLIKDKSNVLETTIFQHDYADDCATPP